MQIEHPKASGGDYGTKRELITANKDKYSISAMCRWLKISRALATTIKPENQYLKLDLKKR